MTPQHYVTTIWIAALTLGTWFTYRSSYAVGIELLTVAALALAALLLEES